MSNCSPNLQSAASLPTISPSYSANVSSSPYILSLARLPGPTPIYALATSPPSNAILLYTASPSGLTKTANLPIGGTGLTVMRVAPDFCGRPTLLSSQQQPGCVKVWDERKGPHPALEILPPKNRGILAFDVSSDGRTLAAGTDLQSDDASIFYWDPRNTSQPLRTHSSTHSDDITALHFHPTQPHIILSASTDGLLSTSDAREADEDEAVLEVANWGCSVARGGWFNRGAGVGAGADHGVWAASDMETFGLWTGDLDLLNDFGDARQPALPGNRWTTDYLVDAADFSNAPGPFGASGLTLFLGSNTGDIALASTSHLPDIQPSWTVRGILRGGHADAVVRSILWDSDNGILLTGDEAGKLAAWRPMAENADADVEMADADAELSRVGAGTKRGWDDGQEQGKKRGRYEG